MRDYLLALCCAAAVFAGVVACFLPGARRPVPAAPYCLELPVLPVALEAAPKKKCEPACTAPQVCVDGTCCLPAMQHSPGSSNSFAWVEETLR